MISFGVYHKKYNVRHSHVAFASTLTISQEKYLEVYMCIHWFMQEVIGPIIKWTTSRVLVRCVYMETHTTIFFDLDPHDTELN